MADKNKLAGLPAETTTPAPTTTAPVKTEAAPPAHPKLASVMGDLADQLRCRPDQLIKLLKTTVFRSCRRDEEFQMACMVAREYKLNPVLKEIYAFPSQNGVVPIVSVDGWNRIMNSHPMYDGIEFEYAGDIERDKDGEYVGGHGTLSCTARIHRKDRANPVCVTEFYEECWRDTDPWNGMPRRMLRWKALIQAARVAFGFAGIYDFDEGNDILAHENKRVTKDGNIVDVPVVDVGLTREGNIGTSDATAKGELVYADEPDPTEGDEEPVAKVVEAAPEPTPGGAKKRARTRRDAAPKQTSAPAAPSAPSAAPAPQDEADVDDPKGDFGLDENKDADGDDFPW